MDSTAENIQASIQIKLSPSFGSEAKYEGRYAVTSPIRLPGVHKRQTHRCFYSAATSHKMSGVCCRILARKK
jgi:hypothetical protein